MVGNSKIQLGDARAVRAALLDAFQQVVIYAQSQVENPDEVTAVHEFRKSLRRLRSITRWAQDSRRDVNFRPLRVALREVFVITNPLRDADVTATIAESVRHLAQPGEFERIFSVRPASKPLGALEILSSASSKLGEEVHRFEALLPHDLSVADLQRGTRRLYRRCRRRRNKAQRDPNSRAIHDFRKRTKELRYVVETIASKNSLAMPLETDLGQLAKSLGRITDLELFLKHLDLDTSWAVEIQELMSVEFENAVKESSHVFVPSPAEFSRALFLVLRGRFGDG